MSELHPPSKITRDDVAHVAHLARLTLTEDELDRFTEQLAAVLDHAGDVETLEIDDDPPTARPFPLVNVMRPDEVGPTLAPDAVLSQAPAAEDDQFRVPPILGEAP